MIGLLKSVSQGSQSGLTRPEAYIVRFLLFSVEQLNKKRTHSFTVFTRRFGRDIQLLEEFNTFTVGLHQLELNLFSFGRFDEHGLFAKPVLTHGCDLLNYALSFGLIQKRLALSCFRSFWCRFHFNLSFCYAQIDSLICKFEQIVNFFVKIGKL